MSFKFKTNTKSTNGVRIEKGNLCLIETDALKMNQIDFKRFGFDSHFKFN